MRRTLSLVRSAPRVNSLNRVNTVFTRFVTNQVSNQPPSRNVQDLKQNVSQEAKTVKDDIASAIAGANAQVSQINTSASTVKDEWNETTSLAQHVPRQARLFGALGVLPYVATAATTLYLGRQAAVASTMDAETALALLHYVETIQIGYGAVILSFVGSIHWGLEFAGYNGFKGTPRYLLGIAPVVLGLSTTLLPNTTAMVAQFGVFCGTWWMDQQATFRGWTPKWYSTYRFYLTALVGASLVCTIGGTNFFGPGSKRATPGHRFMEIQERQGETKVDDDPSTGLVATGTVNSPIQTKVADDAFVSIANVGKKEAEERKKQEEDERQNQKDEREKQEAEQKRNEADRKAGKLWTPGAVRSLTSRSVNIAKGSHQ